MESAQAAGGWGGAEGLGRGDVQRISGTFLQEPMVAEKQDPQHMDKGLSRAARGILKH